MLENTGLGVPGHCFPCPETGHQLIPAPRLWPWVDPHWAASLPPSTHQCPLPFPASQLLHSSSCGNHASRRFIKKPHRYQAHGSRAGSITAGVSWRRAHLNPASLSCLAGRALGSSPFLPALPSAGGCHLLGSHSWREGKLLYLIYLE